GDGKKPGEDSSQELILVTSGIIDLAVIKLLDEAGVINPHRGKLLVRFVFLPFQCSGDAFRGYGQFTHRALSHLLLKLAVRDGLHVGRKKVLLHIHKKQDSHQEIPDTEMGLRGQAVLLFPWTRLSEQRAKPVYQMPLSLFVIGWHTLLLGSEKCSCRTIVSRFGNRKAYMPPLILPHMAAHFPFHAPRAQPSALRCLRQSSQTNACREKRKAAK